MSVRRIGIKQARLLPPEEGRFQCFPRHGWAHEFALAEAAELDSIQWMDDVWGEQCNPVFSDDGVEQIRELCCRHSVAVESLCADYFVERPLIAVGPAERTERLQRLLWLISRCQKAEITRIVLPFLDNSAINSAQEMKEAVAVLREALPAAAEAGVEIHLETSLAPTSFAAFLDQLPFANALVNYDTGNSASLGYDYYEELTCYGARIGGVHIKDRLRGGGTVPLGQGSADFPGVLQAILQLGYSGDFIFEAARGASGEELTWARRNRQWLLGHFAAIPAQGKQ